MLGLFAQLYPRDELEKETAVAWEWAMEGISDDRMLWAARQITDEPGRRFFPTPNELKGYLPHQGNRPRVITASPADDEHWSDEAIQKRNAMLREENGKLNAEYARRFPAVWGERPNFNR